MPIHHTKLTMAKPQPMGMLMPQMPTPLMTSQPIATVINPMRLKAIEKPTNQPREVGRVRTIALILSVTDPKVYPGPITGVSRRISGESNGGCSALMPTPVRDSDCEPQRGRWCAAAHSVRQEANNSAAAILTLPHGC